MSSLGRLKGKSTIVTGAGSGVGRAASLRFAEHGARVVCADIDGGAAGETARLVEAAGGVAVPLRVDVSREDEVVAMVAAAVEHFGRLDALFNNVGIPTPRLGMTFEEHTADDFDKLYRVNVGGVFYGCKHAVIRFKEQGDGGAIVNTGSVAGLVGWGGSVYGATKGAVHQLTRAVAIEAAPYGVRVNAICPAAMPRTGFMAAGGMTVDEADMPSIEEYLGTTHPLGKAIAPEDCADAALFLLSDESSNITGTLLPIDGGFVAR